MKVLTIGDEVSPIGEKASALVFVVLTIGEKRSAVGLICTRLVLPATATKSNTICTNEPIFTIQLKLTPPPPKQSRPEATIRWGGSSLIGRSPGLDQREAPVIEN